MLTATTRSTMLRRLALLLAITAMLAACAPSNPDAETADGTDDTTEDAGTDTADDAEDVVHPGAQVQAPVPEVDAGGRGGRMPARAADHGDESARTLARAGPERPRRATRRRGDVTRARMETCRSGTRLAYK